MFFTHIVGKKPVALEYTNWKVQKTMKNSEQNVAHHLLVYANDVIWDSHANAYQEYEYVLLGSDTV
jgi:hypothetical protein